MDNLDIIKKAINVEVKNKYINIRGKKQYFSAFMCSHIRKILKKSLIPERWKVILKYFELYSTSSMPDRKIAIEYFVKVMKLELAERESNPVSDTSKPDPFSSVTYVKGVGICILVLSPITSLSVILKLSLLFKYEYARKAIDG